VVACAESVAVGIRIYSGQGWDCLLTVLPGDEERVRERQFPLRGYVVCQINCAVPPELAAMPGLCMG